MSWREFELTVKGYFLRLARQKWNFREVIWHLWAANSTSDSFSLRKKDIMLLPWDEPDTPMVDLTPEQIEEIRLRFDKIEAKAGLDQPAE